MLLSDLTPKQQEVVVVATNVVREYAKAISKIVWKIRVAQAGSGFNEFSTLVSSLNPGELIPNETGLTGARSLSREQLLALLSFAGNLSDLVTESVMSALVDAVGPQNITD